MLQSRTADGTLAAKGSADMMDTEHKLMVLADIARELNKEKITWAIGASLMLYLRGIVTQFHDIDIMVAECDAERAEQAICRIGKEQPRNGTAQYKTRYFIEFTVDGVDVDLMAGFVIVLDGTDHECPLLPEDITETRIVNGENVPLHSAARWAEYYRLMGRDAKAGMVKEWIDRTV